MEFQLKYVDLKEKFKPKLKREAFILYSCSWSMLRPSPATKVQLVTSSLSRAPGSQQQTTTTQQHHRSELRAEPDSLAPDPATCYSRGVMSLSLD